MSAAGNLTRRRLIDEISVNAKAFYRFHNGSIGKYVEQQMSRSKRRLQNRGIAQYYLQRFERTGDRADYPKIMDHFLKSGDAHNACLYQIRYFDDLASLYYEDYPSLELAQDLEEPDAVLRICSQAALCCMKIGNHEMLREYIERYGAIAKQNAHLGEEGYSMYLRGVYHYSEGRCGTIFRG